MFLSYSLRCLISPVFLCYLLTFTYVLFVFHIPCFFFNSLIYLLTDYPFPLLCVYFVSCLSCLLFSQFSFLLSYLIWFIFRPMLTLSFPLPCFFPPSYPIYPIFLLPYFLTPSFPPCLPSNRWHISFCQLGRNASHGQQLDQNDAIESKLLWDSSNLRPVMSETCFFNRYAVWLSCSFRTSSRWIHSKNISCSSFPARSYYGIFRKVL